MQKWGYLCCPSQHLGFWVILVEFRIGGGKPIRNQNEIRLLFRTEFCLMRLVPKFCLERLPRAGRWAAKRGRRRPVSRERSEAVFGARGPEFQCPGRSFPDFSQLIRRVPTGGESRRVCGLEKPRSKARVAIADDKAGKRRRWGH